MNKEVAKIINELIGAKTIISEQGFRRFLSNLLPNSTIF